jgi:hypothetical protein
VDTDNTHSDDLPVPPKKAYAPKENEPTEWMSDANFEAFRPFLNKFTS